MDIEGRKINVRFYLNQDVKGRRVSIGDSVLYPLYVRVTYNRRTTRFAVANNWFPLEQEDSLDSIKELSSFKSVLENVIAFEAQKHGEGFKLSGLGERMKTYSSTLFHGLEYLLNKRLKEVAGDIFTHREYNDWDQKSLYEKTIQCIDTLGENMPDSLRECILNVAFFSPGGGAEKILIYSWLISADRNYIIEGFHNRVDMFFQEEEKRKFKAFDRILVEKKEDFLSMPESIDNACQSLINEGYTEHFEIKSIVFSTE